jgi:hypothetical protein
MTGQQVETIHADLRAPTEDHQLDLTKTVGLAENQNIAFQGIVPRSSLKKKEAQKRGLGKATFVRPGPSARELLKLPLNPNGRPNSDVIVPFLTGDDITSRPLDRFIVDFRDLTEQEAALYAKRRGIAIRVARLPMTSVLRARTIGETRGFMKALIDARGDRILGFTMLGSGAGEVIAAVQSAMLAGLAYTGLRDAILTHPTMAEGLGVPLAGVPAMMETTRTHAAS